MDRVCTAIDQAEGVDSADHVLEVATQGRVLCTRRCARNAVSHARFRSDRVEIGLYIAVSTLKVMKLIHHDQIVEILINQDLKIDEDHRETAKMAAAEIASF